MPRIFISYRRDDSGYIAGMLAERLEAVFGSDSVFIDVDAIPLGVDFREYLNQAVAKSELMLALIGNEWLNVKNAQGLRRLDDPADFVRIEIEAALKQNIPVVPVLLEQARMPLEAELPPSLQLLAFRNATEIRSGRDLNYHIEQLIRGIKNQYGVTVPSTVSGTQPSKSKQEKVADKPDEEATAAKPTQTSTRTKFKPLFLPLVAVGSLAVLGLAIGIWMNSLSNQPQSEPNSTPLTKIEPSSNSFPLNKLASNNDLNNKVVQQVPSLNTSKVPPVEQLPLPNQFDINSITPSKAGNVLPTNPSSASYFKPCLAGTRNVIVGSGYDTRAEALTRLKKFRTQYPTYTFKLLNTVANSTSAPYSNEQSAIVVGHGLDLDTAVRLANQVRTEGLATDAYISTQTVDSDCFDLS
ncbi:TIR domain-containing protein [uncultured Thiothrix sp.]|uniref:TIR domain-containing protein n=1 Tax=uncultured Thiothrix sp. TaxID=223185 RepID=UPI002618B219|nr:TIR domain-containing protein [uncultured Thiothrix sp.]